MKSANLDLLGTSSPSPHASTQPFSHKTTASTMTAPMQAEPVKARKSSPACSFDDLARLIRTTPVPFKTAPVSALHQPQPRPQPQPHPGRPLPEVHQRRPSCPPAGRSALPLNTYLNTSNARRNVTRPTKATPNKPNGLTPADIQLLESNLARDPVKVFNGTHDGLTWQTAMLTEDVVNNPVSAAVVTLSPSSNGAVPIPAHPRTIVSLTSGTPVARLHGACGTEQKASSMCGKGTSEQGTPVELGEVPHPSGSTRGRSQGERVAGASQSFDDRQDTNGYDAAQMKKLEGMFKGMLIELDSDDDHMAANAPLSAAPWTSTPSTSAQLAPHVHTPFDRTAASLPETERIRRILPANSDITVVHYPVMEPAKTPNASTSSFHPNESPDPPEQLSVRKGVRESRRGQQAVQEGQVASAGGKKRCDVQGSDKTTAGNQAFSFASQQMASASTTPGPLGGRSPSSFPADTYPSARRNHHDNGIPTAISGPPSTWNTCKPRCTCLNSVRCNIRRASTSCIGSPLNDLPGASAPAAKGQSNRKTTTKMGPTADEVLPQGKDADISAPVKKTENKQPQSQSRYDVLSAPQNDSFGTGEQVDVIGLQSGIISGYEKRHTHDQKAIQHLEDYPAPPDSYGPPNSFKLQLVQCVGEGTRDELQAEFTTQNSTNHDQNGHRITKDAVAEALLMKDQLIELRNQLDEKDKTIAELKGNAAKALQDLTEDRERKEQEITKLNDALSASQADVCTLTDQLQRQAAIPNAQKHLMKLTQDLKTKEAEVRSLQEQIHDLNKSLTTAQNLIGRLSGNNIDLLTGATHFVAPSRKANLPKNVLGCIDCYTNNVTCDNHTQCLRCKDNNIICRRFRCSVQHVLKKPCPDGGLICKAGRHNKEGWLVAEIERPEW